MRSGALLAKNILPFVVVSRHGGIAPAVRRRALLALTLREREEISRGLASAIADRD
jgi:hypothetical protein